MTIDEIRSTREGGILEITFARPKLKNAFSVGMYQALADLLRAADGDDDVRVVLLRGEGGDFSSGNDLKDFVANPPTGSESAVFQFMHAIAALTKPVVAVVEGVAVGIGATMLVHCDLVYASESAKLSMPFVNLGLVPEAASSFVLPRTVGHRRAAELLFFGEPFGADVAREVGLVNQVLPAAEVYAFARKRAEKLAEQSPVAIRRTKQLLKVHQRDELLSHLDLEARVFVELLGTDEVKEILTAFLEKRKPDVARFRR